MQNWAPGCPCPRLTLVLQQKLLCPPAAAVKHFKDKTDTTASRMCAARHLSLAHMLKRLNRSTSP